MVADVNVGDLLTNLPGLGRSRRLRVDWFDTWQPVLDEALRELPEMESCSHELYRLLMENAANQRKVTALVTEQGQPVAVAGLRRSRTTGSR